MFCENVFSGKYCMSRLHVIYSLLMNFMVQHRDSSGAMREERIEAANRTQCVAECRRRGITPVAIREGDTVKETARALKKTNRSGSSSPIWLRCLIGCLILIGAACCLRIALRKSNEIPSRPSAAKSTDKQQASKRIVDDKTVNSPQDATEVVSSTQNSEAPPRNLIEGVNAWHGLEITKVISELTNENGTVVRRFETEDGKTHRLTIPPRPIFDNASDQLLLMALTGASGSGAMPPLPLSSAADADFKKSLEKPIVINESDASEVKALKEMIIQARQDMLHLIEQGYTVQEALAEQQKMVNENAELRAKLREELKIARESGNEVEAEEFREKINDELRAMGIKEIGKPMTPDERRALRSEP